MPGLPKHFALWLLKGGTIHGISMVLCTAPTMRNNLEDKEGHTNASQADSAATLLVWTVLPGFAAAVNVNPLLHVTHA